MASSFYVLRHILNTAQIHPQKVAVALDNQAWTYSELNEQIKRVACHLHSLNIVEGQIIYQCLDRGYEMICGLLGIMCAGGVYFPLNPTEPTERLITVLKQTHGQYVLVHQKTREKFPLAAVDHVVLLDSILLLQSNVDDMSDILVCSKHGPIYMVCTSGTTGRQKVVVHTHTSVSASIGAFLQWNLGVYTSQNQVLQVATCSWIYHLIETLSTLAAGGTLVLLRPGGHLDMAYLSQSLLQQQITTFLIGPGIIRALTNYLEISQRLETFKFVHKLCTGGEAMKPQEWIPFMKFLNLFNVQVISMYGMSECSVIMGCQLLESDYTTVPIGNPLPGVFCLLINEQGQIVSNKDNSGEIGQIHIGGQKSSFQSLRLAAFHFFLTGLTLFNCYLDDSERTTNMFVNIDKETYIKTGDLARYNARDELVYVERVDFQIKIRGQRVETAEIEKTILNWSPAKVSNCLVTKFSQNDDLLVAYIISNDVKLDTKEIRDYCNKHLRQYMVPSYFVVLDKFPLNTNGKVDRKQLPLPSLLYDTSIISLPIEDQPMSKLEEKVHNLWCSILQLDAIPRHANCFAVGGSSLLLMQLFNYYQFHLAPDKQLNALDFFINPTIAEHVQLLINSEPKLHTIYEPFHIEQDMFLSNS